MSTSRAKAVPPPPSQKMYVTCGKDGQLPHLARTCLRECETICWAQVPVFPSCLRHSGLWKIRLSPACSYAAASPAETPAFVRKGAAKVTERARDTITKSNLHVMAIAGDFVTASRQS